MPTVSIEKFGPDDAAQLAASVEVTNAVRAVDAPWEHLRTVRAAEGQYRHGWDGEPAVPFLATVDGEAVALGECMTSEWDNLHVAGVKVEVHPEHRRRGYGTQLLEALTERARGLGRTSLITDGWEADQVLAFAAQHGLDRKLEAINRRQFLADLDWAGVEKLREEAQAAAASYELVRRVGSTPDDELEATAQMVAAINDAPIDDLDIEDEVFTPGRVRAYENAHAARGLLIHRIFARHRETGELAGHTVVIVDSERRHLGEQEDTSVVRSHRGHRLGVLLKSEMNLWLRDVQPQLEEIDTWNAESNSHMIAVNELLSYRIMGRGFEFQKSI